MKLPQRILVSLSIMAPWLTLSSNALAQAEVIQNTYKAAAADCYSYDSDTSTGTYVSVSMIKIATHYPNQGDDESSFGSAYMEVYSDVINAYCYGYGQVIDQQFASNGRSASLTAWVTLDCYTYEAGTGEYLHSTRDLVLEVDLQAVQADEKRTHFNDSDRLPSYFNFVSNLKGTYAPAEPRVLVDGRSLTSILATGSIWTGRMNYTLALPSAH